jgi:hypothetical protein
MLQKLLRSFMPMGHRTVLEIEREISGGVYKVTHRIRLRRGDIANHIVETRHPRCDSWRVVVV